MPATVEKYECADDDFCHRRYNAAMALAEPQNQILSRSGLKVSRLKAVAQDVGASSFSDIAYSS
jgi:hypothetical protein